MSLDFDDILGGDEEPLPEDVKNFRLRNAEAALQEAARKADVRRAGMGQTKISAEEFLLPVSQNFLGQVLHMDPATVKKRLRDCPVAGTVGAGRPVYYFHEAIQWLVKPKMDVATYLKTLNPAQLPNAINKSFWEAERIKLDVMIKSGDAWTTEKALAVLGEVFMMINDRIPLIEESVRDLGVPDEVQDHLEKMCEQFRTDLYQALKEMPVRRQTYSRQVDIDPDAVAEPLPPIDGEGEF